MASGKTTFGRAAAERCGWTFVDLDEEIARRHGTPAEIFAAFGEGRFREIESEMLHEALLAEEDTVLALGGGTILREENLRLLKEHRVACVPGSAFGASGAGFVRMSYATSMEKLRIAVERIGQMVRQLPRQGH